MQLLTCAANTGLVQFREALLWATCQADMYMSGWAAITSDHLWHPKLAMPAVRAMRCIAVVRSTLCRVYKLATIIYDQQGSCEIVFCRAHKKTLGLCGE